jgi:hypothetical protein
MKVDVITVADVEIGRWRWHSNWIDIAVFDYRCQPWLLQMRISRTNAKSFRAVSMVGFAYRQATTTDVGSLQQMKKDQP